MANLIGNPQNVNPLIEQLPHPPLDPNDVQGMIDWMLAINQRLNTITGDATIPDLVTNVTLEPIYPGVLVSWRPVFKGASYLIYRSTDPDFNSAEPVVQLFGRLQASWFDLTTNIADGAALYYWIRAVNDLGMQGPLSGRSSGFNSAPPIPGTITTGFDPAMFALSTHDDLPFLIGLTTDRASGDDASGSVAFMSGIHENDDFWSSGDFSTGGYSLP